MAVRQKRKDYLKPKEVAAMLQVEPGTVRVWAQNGSLHATTTPGGHRRFSLQDVERFAREHGITLASRPGDELRVLIVDDDKRVARTLHKVLHFSVPDAEVEIAFDGFSAGQMVEKFSPHVIILDLFMPGVDGFQLCRTLKENPATAGIRIIAITGDPAPESVRRILRLGAEACLAKPVPKDQLLSALGV